MIDFVKVNSTINEILDENLIDDRREYSLDDLASAYPHLNEEEIACLYNLIHDFAESEGLTVRMVKPEIIKEYLQEMIHNSFDGWNEASQPVLMSLIFDIMRYGRNVR
jgi:hypothetical protein